MSNQARINLYRRHIAEAQTQQAKLEAQIANAAPSDIQVKIWLNRLEYWLRMERAYRARLQRILSEND